MRARTRAHTHARWQVLTSCQWQRRMRTVIPWTCWPLLPLLLSGWKFAPSRPLSEPTFLLFSNFPPSRKRRRWLSTEAAPQPRPLPSGKPVGERRRVAPHWAGKFGTAVARATIAVTLCRREIQQRRRPRPFPPPVGGPSPATLRSLQMCKLLCEAPTALVFSIHSTREKNM